MASGDKKKTLGNFLSLSLLQIGNYVLPMLTLPIISRIIGPDNYGVISYAFAFVGYFVLLINAGFDLYGSRLITANKGNKEALNEIFTDIITTKAMLLVVASLIFSSCLFFIPQLREERTVFFFTFLICIGWVLNPSWLYHGMQESRRYALFSFISKLLFSVFVVFIVTQREDYIYHPLLTSLAHILVSVVSFRYAIKKYDLRITGISMKKISDTFNKNRKLSVIWWVSNQASSTNILLAGFVLSYTQTGYFSAALRMIIILQSVISLPVNTVLFPYIGQAFNESYEKGLERIHRILPYVFILSAGLSIVTFLLAKFIIIVFFGNEFAEAVTLLRIMSCVLFFSAVNSAFGQQVLLNLKADGTYMKYAVAGFVINIILLFLFLHYGGISGAALAWPVSEIVIMVAFLVYFKAKKIELFKIAYYNPVFLFQNIKELLRLRSSKKQGI